MLNDWSNTLINLRKGASRLLEGNPKVFTAYKGLNEAVAESSALDAKTRELISMAVAVTTRCDGCISSHIDAAIKAGATKQEISEALGTAIALNAGAAFVYSVRALEAYDQMSAKV
jgi:AhpD family alkylhydroperoxidase